MIPEVLAPSETYRVEVSGWDENQSFFVEKSDLAFDDFAGHHISLKRMMVPWSLSAVSSHKAFPNPLQSSTRWNSSGATLTAITSFALTLSIHATVTKLRM